MFIALSTFSQQTKKVTNKKPFKCTTYIYNLNIDGVRIRDICYSVNLMSHFDMNEYRPASERDKKNDLWKYSISITDNEKRTTQSLEASFYVYEESSEIIQYHCIVESADIKAIIFNKQNNTWQILLLQNEVYKILTSYPGYHYTNAFNIRKKSNSGIDY